MRWFAFVAILSGITMGISATTYVNPILAAFLGASATAYMVSGYIWAMVDANE